MKRKAVSLSGVQPSEEDHVYSLRISGVSGSLFGGTGRIFSHQFLLGVIAPLILLPGLLGQEPAPLLETHPYSRCQLPDAPSSVAASWLSDGKSQQATAPPRAVGPGAKPDSQGPPSSSASKQDPLRLKGLPRDILRDQKFFWTYPAHLKRRDLPWAAGFLGTSGILITTDAQVGQALSDSPPGDGVAFSRRVGQLGGLKGDFAVATAFYLLGRWGDNERARATGVLGYRALADSLIVVESLKSVARRPRPTRAGGSIRVDNAEGHFFEGGRSFPSGHAIEAWSLATVAGCQYRHRRWVAPLAYGLAGLVSVSRVTERQHFPADVFVGGALGFMIGRHVCHASGN